MAKKKKTTKKKASKRKPTAKFQRAEHKDGGYTFKPTDKGWTVHKGGTKLGLITAKKEATGRHCFVIDGDPTKRTYRGKLKAAQALESAVSTAKKHKGLAAIFVAWEGKPRASDQWGNTKNARTTKKKAKRKVTKKKAKKK